MAVQSLESPSDPSAAPARPTHAPVRARAYIIGAVLVPILVGWTEYTEVIARGADLVAMSLSMAAVVAMLALVVVNIIVSRLFPEAGLFLTQSELIVMFAINSTSLGICGLGLMQFLPHELAGATYYTTPQNGWSSWTYLVPAWAVPAKSVINDYYNGNSSFFTAANLMGWMRPMIVWTVFLMVLVLAFYCINSLLRRQWVESERLQFPIAQIPIELTEGGGVKTPLWKNKLFWIAFGFASVVESLAALHYSINPLIPYMPIKANEPMFNIGQNITTPPWNGIGSLYLSAYPLVIGLTYLLARDVSFSCWAFYFIVKAENVMAVAFGFREPGAPPAVSRIPYTDQQGIGSFIGLAIMSLLFAWPHLKRAFGTAFLKGPKDDANEPMSYRAAYIGLLFSVVFLVGFAMALGVGLIVGVLFFLIFLVFALAYTRIRAESGIPWGGGPGPMAHGTLVDTMGSQNFRLNDLVGISYLHWCDSDFRTLPMANQMEALKMSELARIHPRHITWSVFLGSLLTIVASWIALLYIYYHFGASSAHVEGWRTGQGHYGFEQLQSWIQNSRPFDMQALGWIVVGVAVTIGLSLMRTNFVWWPFHPVGYAIANVWAMEWMWCAFFIGWLCKDLTIRYGGVKAYRTFLPFFIGLVLGDYAISGLWAIFYAVTGIPGYRTFPI